MGKITTFEERVAEIENRIWLVGPIPRGIFNSYLFNLTHLQLRKFLTKDAKNISDLKLYEAMLGRYTSYVTKHNESGSGMLFHVFPEPVYCDTWMQRRQIFNTPVFQLTNVSIYELRDRLERGIEVLREEKFDDFAFDWVCATEGRKPEKQRQYDEEGVMTTSAFYRVATLRDSDQRVYRPASANFPMVEFAASCTKWFCAISEETGD